MSETRSGSGCKIRRVVSSGFGLETVAAVIAGEWL